MTYPQPAIIKLSVEHMKHEMLHALQQHTTELDETLAKAVSDYCTPETIERVIYEETERVLNAVIKEEVRRWFTYGEGREVIKRAVAKRLENGTTFTPLDREAEE